MDALGLESAVVVGHSMGSMVAQRFVVDHPDRVSALVLIGAFSTLFQDPGLTDFYRISHCAAHRSDRSVFAREWQLSTLARAMPEDLLDTVVAETLKVPARVWHAAFKGFLETPDFSDDLAGVTVPTLIEWGDQDTYALARTRIDCGRWSQARSCRATRATGTRSTGRTPSGSSAISCHS